jgi:UPF0755 protein
VKKNKHYSYHSPKKSRVRALFISIFVIFIFLVGLTFGIRRVYNANLQPVSQSYASNIVTIPSGSSLTNIANILKNAGVIKSVWAFEWYVRNDNTARDNIEAGTYNIHSNQNVQSIVSQLTDGQINSNLVVILPNQRLDQIESALIHDGFSKSDVMSAMNPALYENKYSMFATKPASASLEGFLYPDSFAKTSTTKAGDIINESLAEMQKHLTPAIVNGMAAQGLNIYQGITLASIVGQEVSKVSDMPTVAQVFLLRLKSNMSLGSDVTAYYGAILAGQAPSVSYPSAYNTRLVNGLPPGPISNVNDDSLNAVANPSGTNYLYFVTGDNGTTYFAQTLDEHNQQTQMYCQKLCN